MGISNCFVAINQQRGARRHIKMKSKIHGESSAPSLRSNNLYDSLRVQREKVLWNGRFCD